MREFRITPPPASRHREPQMGESSGCHGGD
jgi:hypothetical protein